MPPRCSLISTKNETNSLSSVVVLVVFNLIKITVHNGTISSPFCSFKHHRYLFFNIKLNFHFVDRTGLDLTEVI